MEGLSQLKLQTDNNDIILTKPFNRYSHALYENQPWPIYTWDSTGYISAYTSRQTFFTAEWMMRQLHLPTEDRLKEVEAFFDEALPSETKKKFIKDNQITFLYLHNEELGENLSSILIDLGFKEIFSNREVTIFRVENQI